MAAERYSTGLNSISLENCTRRRAHERRCSPEPDFGSASSPPGTCGLI